jgi:DNA-binding MarR family transcriptional regulator
MAAGVVLSLSQIDMSLVITHTALTVELAKVLGRIGRGLRYHTRAAREALDITQSEGELLRLVDRRPGIRVQDAAIELGIASNSVSTLVRQLKGDGLLERSADPADGRAACLRLTPSANEWVTQLGNAREQTIDRALASLDEQDRQTLEAAIPAMKRLAKAISASGQGGAAQ